MHKLLVIEPDGKTRQIKANESNELRLIKDAVGGDIDIGMFRKGERLMQYAVYEWSVLEEMELNPTASEMTERRVFGTCVVWGVGDAGESTSWATTDE